MTNYHRTIIPVTRDPNMAITVDVYSVLEAFGITCPALAHSLKKLLCAGQRGHKSRLQDLREAQHALDEAILLEQAREAMNAGRLDRVA